MCYRFAEAIPLPVRMVSSQQGNTGFACKHSVNIFMYSDRPLQCDILLVHVCLEHAHLSAEIAQQQKRDSVICCALEDTVMRLYNSTGDAPFSYCDNYAGGAFDEVCNIDCYNTGLSYFGNYSLLDSANVEYNVVRTGDATRTFTSSTNSSKASTGILNDAAFCQ